MIARVVARELGKFDDASLALKELRNGESLDCRDDGSFSALFIKSTDAARQHRVDGLVACVRLIDSAVNGLRDQRLVVGRLFQEANSCGDRPNASPVKLRAVKSHDAEMVAMPATDADDIAREQRTADVMDALIAERDSIAHYRTRIAQSTTPVRYLVSSPSVDDLLSVLRLMDELLSK